MTDLSVWLFLVVVVLYVALKLLNFGETPRAPKLIFREDCILVKNVLRLCPIFHKPYVPPLLWGRNGHLQTFAFAKVSPYTHFMATSRHSVKLDDNSNVIFDIFEPSTNGKQLALEDTMDITIAVVPGIANDSSAAYIQSFCECSTSLGFRIVVLNHLGVLPVKLMSKRIFTYGSTTELDAMVGFIVNNYPDSRLIGVGFSMGANILVKYLGETPERQKNFMCAVSVCQGYDILKACVVLDKWDGLRRGYNWLIAQRVKQVIKRHEKELFDGSTSNSKQLNRNKVLMANSLKDIDEYFVRRMAGFPSLTDYYSDSSSSRHINNVEIPLLLLNAQDDPLIPDEVLDTPRNYVLNRPNNKSLFVLSQFGGHLGFYEGGLFRRNKETWLNKAILQYLSAIVEIERQHVWKKPKSWKQHTGNPDSL